MGINAKKAGIKYTNKPLDPPFGVEEISRFFEYGVTQGLKTQMHLGIDYNSLTTIILQLLCDRKMFTSCLYTFVPIGIYTLT